MNLIRRSLRRPFTVIVAVVALCLGGWMAILQRSPRHFPASSPRDLWTTARLSRAPRVHGCAAEKTLTLARERKACAVGEVLENIQAEQDLTRARLDYLTAITENNRAQFLLRRALGDAVRTLKAKK